MPSTVTRHYVLPTCALAKGNPIAVTPAGETKTSVMSVQWAYDDSFVVSADADGVITPAELFAGARGLGVALAAADEASLCRELQQRIGEGQLLNFAARHAHTRSLSVLFLSPCKT